MIQLRGVSYTYPSAAAPALSEIDLEVREGEWLLLAGPSGGGKSTLLYLLNGLVPHVLGGDLRGDVQVAGLVPADVPLRELSRRVGTVFQNSETQLFMLRAGADVAFGCENLCLPPTETKGRVGRALRQLSLTPLQDHEVPSLSGGQKQRLAIAGALAMGCRTLLLDEPTSDLDDDGRAELLSALHDLHRAGHTILMAEHRLEGLEGLVDRTVGIEGGRIVSNGAVPAEKPLSRRQPPEYRADSAPLVDVQDVTFAYPGRSPVLERLSFCLRPGEVAALVGHNGSGKSTLLKLLCGLLRASRGRIVTAGKENPRTSALVGEVGFLFQNPDEQLLADSVVEEIAFGPKNLGLPADTQRVSGPPGPGPIPGRAPALPLAGRAATAGGGRGARHASQADPAGRADHRPGPAGLGRADGFRGGRGGPLGSLCPVLHPPRRGGRGVCRPAAYPRRGKDRQQVLRRRPSGVRRRPFGGAPSPRPFSGPRAGGVAAGGPW